MSDEDIKQLVREFKEVMSQQLESVHAKMDRLDRKLSLVTSKFEDSDRKVNEIEISFINEIRLLSQRVSKLEERAS